MVGQPQAPVGDTVIAVVERDHLGGVLAAVHGGGYGPLARVFDPARGPLAGQLSRAGLPVPPEAENPGGTIVLLAVTAPGRAVRVADAMATGGAQRVYVTARGASDRPPLVHPQGADAVEQGAALG